MLQRCLFVCLLVCGRCTARFRVHSAWHRPLRAWHRPPMAMEPITATFQSSVAFLKATADADPVMAASEAWISVSESSGNALEQRVLSAPLQPLDVYTVLTRLVQESLLNGPDKQKVLRAIRLRAVATPSTAPTSAHTASPVRRSRSTASPAQRSPAPTALASPARRPTASPGVLGCATPTATPRSTPHRPPRNGQHCVFVEAYLTASDWSRLCTNGLHVTEKVQLLAERCIKIGLHYPTERCTKNIIAVLVVACRQKPSGLMVQLNMHFKHAIKVLRTNVLALQAELPRDFPDDPQDFRVATPAWYWNSFSEEPPAPCPLDRLELAVAKDILPCRISKATVPRRDSWSTATPGPASSAMATPGHARPMLALPAPSPADAIAPAAPVSVAQHSVIALPPADGSSAATPAAGSSVAMPADGSSAATPAAGSSVATPAAGSSAAPPAAGVIAAMPAGGMSAAPPAGGMSAAPPAVGSIAAPPVAGTVPAPAADDFVDDLVAQMQGKEDRESLEHSLNCLRNYIGINATGKI